MTKDEALFQLGNAIREAMDAAMETVLTPDQIREEVQYQLDNYEWDL